MIPRNSIFSSWGCKPFSFNKKRQPEYDVTASICDILIRQLRQYSVSAAACTFLIWNVALNLQLFGGQDKHGHAANTQGACSQIRCGESPRALGQKVPLGDQKTFTLEPSAKLWWSCGSGVWSFAAAKLCHERLQERQLNGAHSFHASLLQMLGKDVIASQS